MKPLKRFLIACLMFGAYGVYAATGDTANELPYVKTPVPDQTVQAGSPWLFNGFYYIPCTTYQGSTSPYSANYALTPPVPGVTMDPLTGLVSGTPTGSVSGVSLSCSSPTLTASDIFNFTLQTAQLAVGYFVDGVNGNDANIGTSAAAPWKTLNKVNATSKPVGADVWIKAGTTYAKQRFFLNWDGTANDYAIYGLYYLNGGVAYQGYSNSVRPIVTGTYDSTCSRSLNPTLPTNYRCAMNQNAGIPANLFPAGSAFPGDMYTGMIDVQCNYCEARDLEADYSAGFGLVIGKAGTQFSNLKNSVSYVGGLGGYGIAYFNASNIIFSGNTSTYGGVGGDHGDWVPGGPVHNGVGVIGNFGDSTGRGGMNILFENNTIETGYGEGLIISNTENVIIRGNRFGNITSAMTYAQDCINCVWEYNVLWGGKPRTTYSPDDPTAYATYGISVISEDFAKDQINPNSLWVSGIVRGNMIAHTTNCMIFGLEPQSAARGLKIDVEVYNNTCINTTGGIDYDSLGANNVIKLELRNNIFYNEAGTSPTNFACSSPTIPAITFNYNIWNAVPTDPDCRGPNDKAGNPLTVGSNFNAKLTQTNTQPTPADFQLQATSPGLGVGLPVTAALNPVPSSIRQYVTYPCAAFDLNGFLIDAVCRPVDPVPDLGALGQ